MDTNYERARRLDAQNRRDWERSLVHYSLAHYPSVSVFRELEAKLAFEAKDAVKMGKNPNFFPESFSLSKNRPIPKKFRIQGIESTLKIGSSRWGRLTSKKIFEKFCYFLHASHLFSDKIFSVFSEEGTVGKILLLFF